MTFGAGFPFFNLYRLAVVARGRRLIETRRSMTRTASSASVRITTRAFDHLLRRNLNGTPWGWQIAGVQGRRVALERRVIITRTPLRISLGGGGTDLPSYTYAVGMVISAAINRYIYIGMNRTFTDDYFIKYSDLERCQTVD